MSLHAARILPADPPAPAAPSSLLRRLALAHAFCVETPLAPEEALQVLRDNSQENGAPLVGLWRSRDHRYFRGTIRGNAFQFQRIIHYRNSFLPCVNGTVEAAPADPRRSVVHVAMAPHFAVLIFCALWLALAGAGAATMLTLWLTDPTRATGDLLFGCVAGTAIAIVFTGFLCAFWFEARAQEAKLRELLGA
ncbi:hypothetical protein DB346_06830 [Verrucomicrobia bacterium LW23]|nr:hypothetical protein DB346_06830 [Verrucomicrobia bacterium LW23]